MLGHNSPSLLPKSRTDLRERYAEVLKNLHYDQLRKSASVVRWLAECVFEGYGDIDGFEVWQKLEEAGVIEKQSEVYNKAKHGYIENAEEGEPFYRLAKWVKEVGKSE